MQKEETKKMILYLAAAFPSQKERLWKNEQEMQSFIVVWHNIMYIFPVEVVRKAIENYIRQGKAFFPTLGEIAALCDDFWREKIEKQWMENSVAEREATKRLFYDPIDSFPIGYTRSAISLIRQVQEGKIKFMSENWKKEFKTIFPEYNPETGQMITKKTIL